LKKLLLIKVNLFTKKGKNINNTTKNAKATIPNNLLGTARNTAYKGRKYHSGVI